MLEFRAAYVNDHFYQLLGGLIIMARQNFYVNVIFIGVFSTLVFLGLTNFAFAEGVPPTCKALVQIKNDLWFVGADGKPILQLTMDQIPKYNAAISIDGRLIAYNGRQNPTTATILDPSGRYIQTIEVNAKDAITDLKWLSTSVLRLQEHISPTSSVFHFALAPSDAKSGDSIRQLRQVRGGYCVMSRGLKNVACINGDSIDVNSKNLYFSPSPFENFVKLQKLDLVIGRAATTTTIPVFNIELKSISKGTAELKISTGDNLWQTEYVRFEDVAPITVSDSLASADPGASYGVKPSLSKEKTGIVTIEILKSSTGRIFFEGGLTWDLSGRRLATIEVDGNGQRKLLLVERNRSDSDEKQSNEAEDEEKEISVVRIPLPIDAPINAVEFISNTRVRVVGPKLTFEQDLPLHGNLSKLGSYKISPSLPTELALSNGSNIVSRVFAWSCQ